MKAQFLGFLLSLIACLCGAHGPYDNSAQLIILGDSLEASATLGIEGAKRVLLNAGLSESAAANALAVRGPSAASELSPELASRFLEISAGGKSLKAQSLRVMTDGLEASFIATYAGPASGELGVRARYFDGVEAMKPGAFVALDENRNIKAQAAFSRSNTETTVALVGAQPQPIAADPVGAVAPHSHDVADHHHEDHAHAHSSPVPWLSVAIAVALLGGFALLFRRRR